MTSPCKLVPQRLAGGRDRLRLDIDAAAVLIKGDPPIRKRKQGPITARADVLARDKFRSALADEDAAGGNQLPAVAFDAQAFADAVAPIANAALTFFMCHKFLTGAECFVNSRVACLSFDLFDFYDR